MRRGECRGTPTRRAGRACTLRPGRGGRRGGPPGEGVLRPVVPDPRHLGFGGLAQFLGVLLEAGEYAVDPLVRWIRGRGATLLRVVHRSRAVVFLQVCAGPARVCCACMTVCLTMTSAGRSVELRVPSGEESRSLRTASCHTPRPPSEPHGPGARWTPGGKWP